MEDGRWPSEWNSKRGFDAVSVPYDNPLDGLAGVAQIFNLLYRRIVFGRASERGRRRLCPNAPQSSTRRYVTAPNTHRAGCPVLRRAGRPPSLIVKRTHHCNELRPAHIGRTVTLSGWVHSRRDLGGLIFIDIRDREGRTQTVFDPSDLPKETFARAAALRSECVVALIGNVRQRPPGTTNQKIATGEVEVAATDLEVLNMAEVLPFPVDDPEIASKVNEELRLQYRYLDLRRPDLKSV